MELSGLPQPGLVGREDELAKLRQSLDNAIDGKGSSVFVSGEAGIGKTRLVSEIIKEAESKGARVIQGWCLAESMEPLMPVKTALREAGISHLISGAPPPLVVSAYLMNEGGMLVAKVEREKLEIDADIFAGMLKAVGNFVKDSLGMVDRIEKTGGLNILGYKEYKVIIEEYEELHLASVTKGSLSEFLVTDMKKTLAAVQKDFGPVLKDWDGDMDRVTGVESIVSRLVTGGKYDGKFLVDDPKMKQENLMDNVLYGIQRSSMEKPILLFLDDLQWADPSTLNMLHYLARNTRKDRVLLLGTYRPEDITQTVDEKPHSLVTVMQNMSRENLLEKIELQRLDMANTKGLVVTALGPNALGEPFHERVFKETEGTPFFVLEVLKLLVEDGALVKEDDSWTLADDIKTMDIPSKVYDVIKRRLNRLMKEQRDLLELASIIGDEFQSEVVGSAAGSDRIDLLRNLAEIEKTHQLIHHLKLKYRFNHAKIREVLYNDIINELRMEYHRLVGDTIAELHKDDPVEVVGELAHHYYEAGDKKAKGYLIKAGDRAKDRYANEEAIQFYKTAMRMIEEEEELISTYGNLGNIYSLLGDLENAQKFFEMAFELEKDDVKRVGLHIWKSVVHEKKGDYDGLKEECKRGLELIGAKETVEKANLLVIMGGLHTRTGNFDKAIEYSLRSLVLATKLRSNMDVAKARQILGVVHIFKGDLDIALEHLHMALDNYRKIDKLTPIPNILSNIGLVHRDQGKFEKAKRLFEEGLDIAERMGDKWGTSSLLNNLGLIYRDTGETDKALELFERGLRISEMMDDKYSIGLRFYNIGEVYMIKGELPLALDYLYKALALSIETSNMRSTIECHINLAYAHLKSGNVEKSTEHAIKAVGSAVEVGAKGTEIMARLCLGTIHVDTNDFDKARSEFAITNDLLGEVEDRQQLAGLHFQYGRLYKRTGEREKAKDNLQKALTMFEEMGMKTLESEVREELEAL